MGDEWMIPLSTVDRQLSTLKTLGRREMLRRAAAAAAGGIALAAPLLALLEGDGKRRFAIGACEWSLGRGDPSSLEVAKEIGLDGVQVNMGWDGDGLHLRRPEVQKEYREAARARGLDIPSIAIAEMNNVPLATEPRAAIWLLDSIEVAKALGAKVILLAFFGRGELKAKDAQAMDRVVGVLKEAAPRAAKAGVVLGIENYLSAEENAAVLDRVGSPAVQVYYDVGNSTDKGYDISKEIRSLKGRICELHAKDGPSLLGKGRIDFRKVREALDDIAFSGWIQIEGAAPGGVVADYRTNLAYLKAIFPPGA